MPTQGWNNWTHMLVYPVHSVLWVVILKREVFEYTSMLGLNSSTSIETNSCSSLSSTATTSQNYKEVPLGASLRTRWILHLESRKWSPIHLWSLDSTFNKNVKPVHHECAELTSLWLVVWVAWMQNTRNSLWLRYDSRSVMTLEPAGALTPLGRGVS